MSSEGINKAWNQLQKYLTMSKITRREEFRSEVIELLEKIFLLDGEFAFENKADQIYFNIQKEYLDSLKKDNKERFGSHFMNHDEAVKCCFCELCELAVLVQHHYDFDLQNAPHFLRKYDSKMEKKKVSLLSQEVIDKFARFFYLRLGDFSRYMSKFDMALSLYKLALKAASFDGFVHNQIGIIYIYRKKFLDALYEYILASNSPDSFRGADLKVQQIFKMQASLNLGNDEFDYDETFLKIVGRCRNVMLVEDVFLVNLGNLLRNSTQNYLRLKKHFVIAVTVWNILKINGNEDVKKLKTADIVVSIIADQFFFLVEKANQNKEEKKNNVLSLIWLYATWIEAKNISLIKKSRNDFICFENFAKLIDHIDESLELSCDNLYFSPFSFIDYEEASGSSLITHLT
ncbi:unnamed protein product [Dracunculus medinensis]|uniref:EST1_DNA_bind domain-containing protein n=1 Tax=Dracunculus medinensis TaxID=318479 RepID=A0A0N4UI72_DRAME|nr:unnamed protein product [Dracunculus medinensis]